MFEHDKSSDSIHKLATLGKLVAGVAHELNTPIGSIAANAQLAMRALAIVKEQLAAAQIHDPRLARALTALEQACETELLASERAAAIVRSLRNFARPDEPKRSTVDLHDGIERTLAVMRHELRHLEIVRDFGDLPPVSCFVDQLEQVFMNLLLNAKQAIDARGTIVIETRAEGNDAVLRFRDSGVGIATDQLERIFEAGFTTKLPTGGTGLGLAISREIMSRHGGRIDVDSKPGAGSTFTLRLPLTPLASEPPPASSPVR